ncbi:hypothetical protein PMM47T1_07001 [Pseudomonas sp. M47T1]|uniref:hypothetical protein n=1 Tax=Pseudomonas sp. M47T1 TaxID=1179778 RepID=UPI0002608574|nr:hypothetical protein [Pseudomonas sp. M47T1]EIK97513.1 hypothetical protein PMM47T1_07001 [Pseudomonas sp. M47T1]
MHIEPRLSPSAAMQVKSIVALLENLGGPQPLEELINPALQAFLLRQLQDVLIPAAEVQVGGADYGDKPRNIRLNADERLLVENLRWTRHKGRDKVYRMAKAMRSQKPWRQA